MTKREETMENVIVCTDKRGVFFGKINDDVQPGADPITLYDAQMAVYWSVDVRGVLGLASGGPTDGCRITAPVPEIELRGVTAVVKCSAKAVVAWKAAPWAH